MENRPRLTSRSSRIVQESVRCVASEGVAEQVVAQALVMAGLDEVPECGVALRSFIDVHLRAAARIYLGVDSSDALCLRLAPLMARLPSAEDALRADASVFDRPTQAPPALGRVLLASADSSRLEQLADWMPDLELVTASNMLSLLDLVRRGGTPTVLLVDCAHSVLDAPTLALLTGDLPSVRAVLLWESEGREEWSFWDEPSEWERCAASPSEVSWAVRAHLDLADELLRPTG